MYVHTYPSVEKFIASLEERTISKVLKMVNLLEQFGHRLGMPQSRKVASNIFELRIRGNQEIRILYCFLSSEAHLLSGFIKKTQKLLRRELQKAQGKLETLTKI